MDVSEFVSKCLNECRGCVHCQYKRKLNGEEYISCDKHDDGYVQIEEFASCEYYWRDCVFYDKRKGVFDSLAVKKDDLLTSLFFENHIKIAINKRISEKRGNYVSDGENGKLIQFKDLLKNDTFFFCTPLEAIQLNSWKLGGVKYDDDLFSMTSWMPCIYEHTIYGKDSCIKQTWQIGEGDAGKYIRPISPRCVFKEALYLGEDIYDFLLRCVSKDNMAAIDDYTIRSCNLADELEFFVSSIPYQLYEGWRCWMSGPQCVECILLDGKKSKGDLKVKQFIESFDENVYRPDDMYVADVRNTNDGFKIEDYKPFSTASWLDSDGKNIIRSVISQYGQ